MFENEKVLDCRTIFNIEQRNNILWRILMSFQLERVLFEMEFYSNIKTTRFHNPVTLSHFSPAPVKTDRAVRIQ